MRKQTRVCVQGGNKSVNISAEVLFHRALKITQVRQNTTLLEVLSHPITAVPTSIFQEDGSMRKIVKADLMHVLEKKVPPVMNAPPPQLNPSESIYI